MENKTGKPAWPAGRYFKYAIGEIVLVMAGILLALQVNNWNQNRLDNAKELFYFNNLTVELSNQLEVINRELTRIEKKIAVLDTLNSQLKQGSSFNSIHNLNDFLTKIVSEPSFETNNSTFNILTSTGQLAVIKNDKLRLQIVTTYEKISWVEEVLRHNSDFVFYPNTFPTLISLIDFNYPEHLSARIKENLNNIDTQLELSKALAIDQIKSQVYQSVLLELKPEVQDLITSIKLEIK